MSSILGQLQAKFSQASEPTTAQEAYRLQMTMASTWMENHRRQSNCHSLAVPQSHGQNEGAERPCCICNTASCFIELIGTVDAPWIRILAVPFHLANLGRVYFV